jgi:hypothetical protein
MGYVNHQIALEVEVHYLCPLAGKWLEYKVSVSIYATMWMKKSQVKGLAFQLVVIALD